MQTHIRRHTLLILFALMIIPVHAQKKGYSRGYIICPDGESIDGWVKDRSSGTFIELYSKIRFKADNARTKRKYSPDEIQGYGINNQHYISLALLEESVFLMSSYYIDENSDRVFLRIIAKNDKLSYYHWEYIDGESNYLDYVPLFHKTGSYALVRVSQGLLGLKRKKLTAYFGDCPELVRAIENKELKKINEVFDFYTDSCKTGIGESLH